MNHASKHLKNGHVDAKLCKTMEIETMAKGAKVYTTYVSQEFLGTYRNLVTNNERADYNKRNYTNLLLRVTLLQGGVG